MACLLACWDNAAPVAWHDSLGRGERGGGADLDGVAGLPQRDGSAEAADARTDDDDLERHAGIDRLFGGRERFSGALGMHLGKVPDQGG